MFVKHTGERFRAVWDEDRSLCMWALQTVENSYQNTYSPHMKRFAHYLELMEAANPTLMAAEVSIYEGFTSDSDQEGFEKVRMDVEEEGCG